MFISLGVMWLQNLRHVFNNYLLILAMVNWLDFFKCFLFLTVFHLCGRSEHTF